MPIDSNDFYRAIIAGSCVDIISGEDVVIGEMMITGSNFSIQPSSMPMLEIEGDCSQGNIVYPNSMNGNYYPSQNFFTNSDIFIRVNGEMFPVYIYNMSINASAVGSRSVLGRDSYPPEIFYSRRCEVRMCLSFREGFYGMGPSVSQFEECSVEEEQGRFDNLDLEEEEEDFGRFSYLDFDGD